MSFRSYSANTTAALQLDLVKKALQKADYRIQRTKGATQWEIWSIDQDDADYTCILSYDGWGMGANKWWRLYGNVPAKVRQILKACEEIEAGAGGKP